MVCSVQLQADLVGNDTNGAIVYGILAFVDKIANGAAIFVLQSYNHHGSGMREAVSQFPAVCLIASALGVYTINMSNFNKLEDLPTPPLDHSNEKVWDMVQSDPLENGYQRMKEN